jgi:hypothetical protein
LGRARARRDHEADAATKCCETSSENAPPARIVSSMSGADHLSPNAVLAAEALLSLRCNAAGKCAF